MKEPIRVLQLCSLTAGGIEGFVMNVYRNTNKNKIVFDFLSYFDKDIEQFYENEVLDLGSKVYKTGSWNYKNPLRKHFSRAKSLYNILKDNNYKIVHIHASDNVWIEDAFVAKIARVPVIIVHSHNSMIPKQEKRYFFKKILHYIFKPLWRMVATDYFSCSDLAAKYLYSNRLISENKVKIVKNGIDAKQYIFDLDKQDRYRNELNLNDKFVIGHIGRFAYQKNHTFLIDIFKEIHKVDKSAILLLVGSGELEQDIRNKVKDLGLDDFVIFYGITNQIANLMQAMNVFVLPSHFEGLPLVGIEAQASGLKLIVSDNVSTQMKLTDSVKYLSLNQTAKEWADEILKYKDGYDRKNTFKEISENGYNIDEVAKILEEFYLRRS